MASPMVSRRRYLIAGSLLLVSGMIAAYMWRDHRQQVSDAPLDGIKDRIPGREITIIESPAMAAGFRFTNVAADAGIEFEYYGGPSRDGHMTEQNGGGVAVFDFDHDGTPDLFFANGSRFDEPAAAVNESNRLYRATGNLTYGDVTETAGLQSFGFGMGACAGDIDNDGFVDLFLACYGRNRLWRNNGDGTFADVTDAAGVGDDSWGTSAAFADLDNDGLLDLYVVNYVEWSPDDEPCTISDESDVRIICSPMTRSGQSDLLFRNGGDGAFSEVGSEAGIDIAETGKGLALSVADFNSDGLLDIYVVNDTTKNFLFLNKSEMLFDESAVSMGAALSSNGVQGAGMGVGNSDYDRNGHLDLCVSNFQNQANDLYANLGDAGFVPANEETGLDLVSRPRLGFGILFADFNLDRWPDMFVANGHIWDKRSVVPDYEYLMLPQVVQNVEGRRFKDVSAGAGNYFTERGLGRSVAVGDLDNDGDPDLVIQHLSAQPAILRNDFSGGANGVSIELIGTVSARQPLGMSITVLDDGEEFVLRVPSGDSFQASHDHRVLFSLDDDQLIDQISVRWSSGIVDVWRDVPCDCGMVRLIENAGSAAN
ncbi:MAG: FG-GAP repeat domain-containing protein [Planctomycetales bacterium]